jgi:hypothetical protein
MSKRKRTIIAIVIVELLLLGGWIWLHGLAMTSPHATADSTRVIGQVFVGSDGIDSGALTAALSHGAQERPAIGVTSSSQDPTRAHPTSPGR